MGKLIKGTKLVCIPCGREVVISNSGVSCTTVWYCGKPMKKKRKITRRIKKLKKEKNHINKTTFIKKQH